MNSDGRSLATTGLMAVMQQAAVEAGCAIMQFYNNGCEIHYKEDATPVSEADHAAEAIILTALRGFLPAVPIVAEEEMAGGHQPFAGADQQNSASDQAFFLVDPLDGTKEFVLRNGDFTVNIALIEQGKPVCGVVYAPVSGQLYCGSPQGAWLYPVQHNQLGAAQILSARVSGDQRVAVASRSHPSDEMADYLREQQISTCLSVGSSLKFCLLAAGQADIYPRFSRTMEWDTAAGDAVLRAAGGHTLTLDDQPLTYGKCNRHEDCDFSNPSFIAYGRDEAAS